MYTLNSMESNYRDGPTSHKKYISEFNWHLLWFYVVQFLVLVKFLIQSQIGTLFVNGKVIE